MIKKLFGTDGARGIANEGLTPIIAYNIGKALALIYKNKLERVKIVVGKDTRMSSDMLCASLCAGITAHGGRVELLGVIPTAGVAYLYKNIKVYEWIIILAYNNIASYNGIKVFNGNGYKITKKQEQQIEELVFDETNFLVKNSEIGKIIYNKSAIHKYKSYLLNKQNNIFKGIKICLDCANGAGGVIAPKVLSELGAKVSVINNSKNGNLINKNCGATNLKNLSETVKMGNFDVGFALDGDADRLMTVDENGEIISGDGMLFLIAKNLYLKNKLNNNVAVGTSMTNFGIEKSLNDLGIKLARTEVGDKYIVEYILKNDLTFGGEQSGHFVFKNYSTTADGILSAIEILKVLKENNEPISKLIKDIIHYPQILINLPVSEIKKQKIMESELVDAEVKNCQNQLLDSGRVVVRASGTESVIRIMLEGKQEKMLEKLAKKLKKVIKKV